MEAWGANQWQQCEIPSGLRRITQIAAGGVHSMALQENGEVAVWGGPTRGRHAVPSSVTDIVAISAGVYECYALRTDGQVLWWGAGSATTISSAPDLRSSGSITASMLRSVLSEQRASQSGLQRLGPVLDIAPGQPYSHALTSNGRVMAWRASAPSITPTMFPIAGVYSLATGTGQQGAAVTADGDVITWNVTLPPAPVVNTGIKATSVVVGQDRVIALTTVGDAQGWGGHVLPRPGMHGIEGLSAGTSHCLGLRSDGEILAWGNNSKGACNVPTGLSRVSAIAAGGGFSLALRQDGALIAWGDNGRGQTNVPPALGGAVAIAAGAMHSLAVTSIGTVVAWGSNDAGQCNVPAGLASVVAVTAGGSHSMALQSDGTVVCWGGNGSGQREVPAELSDVLSIAAGRSHSVALRRAGSVVAWGRAQAGVESVAAWSNIVAIAAGGDNVVGLRGDGAVFVAGDGSAGQADVPTDLQNVSVVSSGDGYVLAAVGRGPLARALSGEGLRWRTSERRPWLAQWQVSTDGQMAGQSAVLLPGEESWVETTVPGPGVVQFWWRTTAGSADDALELTVNGVVVSRRPGRTDWEQRRVGVPAGSKTVRWRYFRSLQSPHAEAMGWLDQVTFEPLAPPSLTGRLVDDSHVAVEFDSVEGLPYLLERTSRFDGLRTAWTVVDSIIGNGRRVILLDPPSDQHEGYYRVVVE